MSKYKKRTGKNGGMYCSRICSPRGGKGSGFHGSWNGVRRGSGNPNSKLNEKYVKELKEKISIGYSINDLSIIYKVSTATIRSIKLGNSWQHVC